MNTALSVTDSQIPTYPRPLSAEEVRQIDAYWRAANYLSVGQIYLLDNPLLRSSPGTWCTTSSCDSSM